MYNLPHIFGSVILKSKLTLEEVGDILSKRIFGGLKFEGKDECIFEEVPAIFIKSLVLGIRIVLAESGGNGTYLLDVSGMLNSYGISNEKFKCKLNDYLYILLKQNIEESDGIIIERCFDKL